MNVFDHAGIQLIGAALLHFVWQGALIALVTAVALFILRRANAQWRYAVACAALCLCVIAPSSYVVQHWADRSEATLTTSSPPALNDRELAVQNQREVSESLALQSASVTDQVQNIALRVQNFVSQQASAIVLIWAFGVMALAVRLLAGVWWVRQQVAHAEQHTHAEWQSKLDRFAQRLNIRTPLHLGLSEQLESPMTAGWWRPMVILPSALVTGMPPDLLEALLAHEVAHIKRFDYVVNLLQSAIEIVLFYHPAVWWISKQIRIEREQIADDLAAGLLGEPRRLALALSELEQFQFINPQPALSAQGENLMLRIKRLIKPELSAKPFAWKLAVPMFGISAACAVLVAQASAVENKAPTVLEAPKAALVSVPAVAFAAAPMSAEAFVAAPDQKPNKRSDAKANGDQHEHLTMALVNPDKGDVNYMSGDRRDRKIVEKLKRDNGGEFLWFREDGKSYIIKDAKLLSQVREAQAPMEAVGAEMEAQGKKMEAQGKVMEEIGKQMEAVEVKNEKYDRAFDQQISAYEKKMEALGRKMEVLAERMASNRNDETNRKKMESLHAEMQEMSKKLQEKMSKLQIDQDALQKSLEPLKHLSVKMEDASKPMEEMGEQMGRLGEKMELLQSDFQKKVKEIIQSAKKNGLVNPVPEA